MTTLKTPASPETQKLLGLEGLRFLATLAVLIWHYQHFAYLGGKQVDFTRSEQPFYGVLQPLYEAGSYGVWIFWCISGFIFFWNYRDQIADRSVDGRMFFVRRLSRLYPLHLATLLLVALLQPLYLHLRGDFFVYQSNDLQHFLAQLLMATDWGPPSEQSFNGPIWSVSLEVLAYAFFFFTLRYVTKSPLAGVVAALACLTFNPLLACCLAFFYAGGLAAVGRRMASTSHLLRSIERTAWCATVIFAVVIVIAPASMPDWALVLTFTPLLLFCLSGPMPVPPPVQRLLETAGNMTYSCYLLHFPFQLTIAIGFSLAQRPIPYQNHWFWAAFVLFTLLASHLTYRYFEAPAQALLRRNLLSKRRRLLESAQPGR